MRCFHNTFTDIYFHLAAEEYLLKDVYKRQRIDRALDHNKDMLIAAARIKEMAAQKRISTAALLPDIKCTNGLGRLDKKTGQCSYLQNLTDKNRCV